MLIENDNQQNNPAATEKLSCLNSFRNRTAITTQMGLRPAYFSLLPSQRGIFTHSPPLPRYATGQIRKKPAETLFWARSKVV